MIFPSKFLASSAEQKKKSQKRDELKIMMHAFQEKNIYWGFHASQFSNAIKRLKTFKILGERKAVK